MFLGVLALTLPLATTLLACHRTGTARDAVVLDVKVDPKSASVGMVSVEVTARDVSGRSASGGTVRLEANMSHPGMKPSVAQCLEAQPGVYRGSLELTMAGDWLIEAAAAFPDGTSVRQSVQLRGVRGR